LDFTGAVTTHGEGSHAIDVIDHSYASIGDASSITTTGADSKGVYVEDSSSSTEFKGGATVTVFDESAFTLYANGGKITSALDETGNVVSGGKFIISGDMGVYKGGMIDLMMTDGAVFTGQTTISNDKTGLSNSTIAFDMTGTKWNVTGSSDVTALKVGTGTNIDLSASPLDTVLRVKNLSSNNDGGTFTFKTDIVNQTANRLLVSGTTDGSHKVSVLNDGSEETTGNERVTLIETADKGGTFTLAHTVELGAFQYGLRSGSENDEDDGQYWELYGAGKKPSTDPDPSDPTDPTNPENPALPDKPSASNAASAAINTFLGNYLLNYAETNTLMQRLGDLRDSDRNQGLWFRGYGGRFESRGTEFVREFDMDYGGGQLGYDRRIQNNAQNASTYIGAFFGYGEGDLNYTENGYGYGKAKNTTLGLYGTYVMKNGFYIDGLAKYVWSKNNFAVYDTAGTLVTGKHAGLGGAGLSLETGKRFRFKADAKDGKWYIEPQAQISWQHEGSTYFSADNGLNIGMGSFDSLIGRLGLLFGYETANTNIYLKASCLKDFDGDMDIRYASGKKIREIDFGNNWWIYGIGITRRINGVNSLYFSLERSSGGYFTEDYSLRAGWRILI
jgi:outer membrane autotransporter protein